ncbi:MAG: hypothetical protein QW356_09140, partial [Candidatus Hadarchaeales archaeon]
MRKLGLVIVGLGLAIMILAMSMVSANPTQPYVSGGFNGWSTTDDPMMYIATWDGNEVYERIRYLEAGENQYKIYVSDWTDQWWGRTNAPGYYLPQVCQVYSSDLGNIYYNAPAADNYVFQFRTSDAEKWVALKRKQVQVPGSFNSWDVNDNNMTKETGDNWTSQIYQVTGPRVENFKFIMGNTYDFYHWGWQYDGDPQPMPHSGRAYRGPNWGTSPYNIKVSFPAPTTENFRIRFELDDWQQPRYWVEDLTVPAKPTLTLPENDSFIEDTTPTFGWSPVQDQSGVTYRLQIDDEDTFASPVFDKGNILENLYTLPAENELGPGTYYWRVRAVDNSGNEGPWSENFTLNIARWGTLESFTGNVGSPVGWILLESWTNTASAPATWGLVENWMGTIQAQVAWFQFDLWSGTCSTLASWSQLESWISTCSSPAYWFQVESWSGTINSPATWSQIDSCSGKVSNIPTWPQLESWTGTAASMIPTWSQVDSWGETCRTTALWSQLESWAGITQAPAQWIPVDTWSGSGTASPTAGWCIPESWEGTISAPIPPPTLLSPIDGAQVADNTPLMRWENHGPFDNFDLQVSTAENFDPNYIVYNKTGITSTSYELENQLAVGTYYWWVRQWRTENCSDWSEYENFRIVIGPPSSPTLLSPEDNENVRRNVTFKWIVGDLSESQRLEVDNDFNPTNGLVENVSLGPYDNAYTIIFGPENYNIPLYWRVVAVNSSGENASDWWTFYVRPAWDALESWTNTASAPATWSLVENWTGTIQTQVAWFQLDLCSGMCSSPASWYQLESWTGTTASITPTWSQVDSWGETCRTTALWSQLDSW